MSVPTKATIKGSVGLPTSHINTASLWVLQHDGGECEDFTGMIVHLRGHEVHDATGAFLFSVHSLCAEHHLAYRVTALEVTL